MSDPKNCMVDVLALSEKLCTHPIQGVLAYATDENFMGRVVRGYKEDAQDVCLLSVKAGKALCDVQNALSKDNLGLFVFDAYRPVRAVQDFASWFHLPAANEKEIERKKLHYPNLNKIDLPALGYAPDTVSRHSFGNAVDVSLISLKNGKLLNMGAIYDYFDEISHLNTPAAIIGEEAYSNRQLLVKVMQEFGFIAYPLEYWHFDYKEREVDTPMDFEITKSLTSLGMKE